MNLETLVSRVGDYTERPSPTKDAIARAIKAERLEHAICCRGADRKPISFGEVYELVYGEKP